MNKYSHYPVIRTNISSFASEVYSFGSTFVEMEGVDLTFHKSPSSKS